MLYIAGIALAYFLFFLMLTKKGKNSADRILTTWLFAIATHILFFYLRISEQLPPELLGVEMPFPLLHGPFLFLYTRAITGTQNKKPWLHFIPVLLDYLYLVQYFVMTNEEKILIAQSQGKGFELYVVVKFWAIVISGFTYVIASFIRLRNHKRNIVNQFSSTEKVNLNWLSYLIYGLTLIWILVLLPQEEPLFIGVVIFVFFLGFFGIRQVGIFNTVVTESVVPGEEIKIALPSTVEKQKYSKSGLTIEMAESLRVKLQTLMENEKLYTQSELSLTELADRLGAQPNHLSQLLNDLEGKSFYDYINHLRIAEFKKLAADPESQKLTIMGLASNCGFNSKSSFNRYFKKVTGQSPSEYVKSIPGSILTPE